MTVEQNFNSDGKMVGHFLLLSGLWAIFLQLDLNVLSVFYYDSVDMYKLQKELLSA